MDDLHSLIDQNIELSSIWGGSTHFDSNSLISTVKRITACVEVLIAAGVTGEIASRMPEKVFLFQLFVEI